MKFEAFTLEEAITKASTELGCSVVDLNIKVIQHPRNGILGLFKKNAIIEASVGRNEPKKEIRKEQKERGNSRADSQKTDFQKNDSQKALKKEPRNRNNKEKQPKKERTQRTERAERTEKVERTDKAKVDIEKAILEVKAGLGALFKTGCFAIDRIEVSKFDDETIDIIIDGADAALLIGKEGYRYKALSYMLHNWIYPKYGYYIRLEIAQFLKNQEEMISVYLKDVIEKAKANGKAQTKPLDGVLVKIALEQLREAFPDKYVGVRSSRHGKFVIVNEYKK